MPKLLLLAAIVFAVWYGFRQVSRRSAPIPPRSSDSRQKAEPTEVEAEDLVRCPTCKTYVPVRQGQSCGRPECPYV